MQRTLFVLFPFLVLFGFTSCVSETESSDIIFENNPLKDRYLILSFSNDVHKVELYTRDTVMYEGYNDILLRIKDKNDKYISYAEIEWNLIADDSTKAPKVAVNQSIDNPDVYTSFFVFPKNTYTKDWSLYLTYRIQSTNYTSNTELHVFKPDENKVTIEEELGEDNKEYLIVLTDPFKPISGYNNCSLIIFEKKDPSEYEILRNLNVYVWPSKEDYIDDLVVELPFRANLDRYQNKLEIIGLGLWQLNVVVKNEHGDPILGQEKSANHPISSLHFPLLIDSFENN